MKLVLSDSLEARHIASTGALACWGWSALALACIATIPGLSIAFAVAFVVSLRIAVWIGAPVLLAFNVYLLWRGRSRRLNWVITGRADRICVRLFVRRGKGPRDANERNAVVLEASEIASVSIRSVNVFLYGPKPKLLEWLVIEPVPAVAQSISDRISPLLNQPGQQVFVTNEEGSLTIEWKWCRPALREFLYQIARECPSVVIGPEDRSELDLNGIWNGLWEKPNAQERRMLGQATRLGFARKCVDLLSLCRCMTRQEAVKYLVEIDEEEAVTGPSALQGAFLCGWRPRS